MSTLAAFKKAKEQLKETVEKSQEESPSYQPDERFYMIKKGDDGNGIATLRLLPQKDPKIDPILSRNIHKFEHNGKKFFAICRKAYGERCPVCEYKNSIWDSNNELARKMNADKRFMVNVYIISEKLQPEVEGKVMILNFGNQIKEEIDDGIKEGINPFFIDEGRNFILKLIEKDKRNNYSKSKFESKDSDLCDGDEEEQEKVFDQIHDLSEFINDDRRMTYEEMQEKMEFVLFGKASGNTTVVNTVNVKPEEKELPKASKPSDIIDDDDDIDYDKLLEDDDIPF